MSTNKSISPRGACEQKLSTAETAQLATLHTAYQQAFLNEQKQREATNQAISDLRRCERAVKESAINLANYRQLQMLSVPKGFGI